MTKAKKMTNDAFIIHSLRRIVSVSMNGPAGDPDYYNLVTAAHALAALEKLGEADTHDDYDFFVKEFPDFLERARKGDSY